MLTTKKTKVLVADGNGITVIDDSITAAGLAYGESRIETDDVSHPDCPQPSLPGDFEFPEKHKKSF